MVRTAAGCSNSGTALGRTKSPRQPFLLRHTEAAGKARAHVCRQRVTTTPAGCSAAIVAATLECRRIFPNHWSSLTSIAESGLSLPVHLKRGTVPQGRSRTRGLSWRTQSWRARCPNGTKILIETTRCVGETGRCQYLEQVRRTGRPLEGIAAAVSDMIPDKLRVSR